ncbi:hypothetical protein BVI2075_780023 [Burkholderia vietnamiensis]|nr:hypothetical protein BVI2075_780023 [Burkholderia vietnamiensis]
MPVASRSNSFGTCEPCCEVRTVVTSHLACRYRSELKPGRSYTVSRAGQVAGERFVSGVQRARHRAGHFSGERRHVGPSLVPSPSTRMKTSPATCRWTSCSVH